MRILFRAIILSFMITTWSFGQEAIISSEAASISINNKTIVVSEDDLDFPLPFTIQYPTFTKERTFVSTVNQVNLIGKLNHPGSIDHVLINDEELDFTEKGLFFIVIDLLEEKNDLYIKVSPRYGKIIIVKYIIDYQQPE